MRVVKGLQVSVLALASGLISFAAAGPLEQGVPVAATGDLEFSPNIVPDGNGGAIVSWARYDPDSGGIFVIAIDAGGTPRPTWPSAGVHVLGGTDPHMAADGAGGAFIVSRSFSAVAFQHVLPGGAVSSLAALPPPLPALGPGHPPGPLEERPSQAQHNGDVMPVVTPDGAGGAFVSYMFNDRFYDTGFLRHHRPDASYIETSLSGITGCGDFTCSLRTPTTCLDGAGGVFAAWGQGCGPRVLRLTGELVVAPGWPSSGIALDSCGTPSPYVGVCEDGVGGAYVAWQGYRSPDNQVRIQRVTASATIAPGWPDTGLVISPHPTMPGSVRLYFGYFCSIVPDGSGGALVAWTDQRADTGDVYVQRVAGDATIAPGWPEHGVGVGAAPGHQQYPVLMADGSGGAIVTWQDERDTTSFAIYANHVDASGTIVPPGTTSGIPVGAGPGVRLAPRIASDGAGGAIIAWVDYRGGNGDIYVGHLRGETLVATLPALLRAETAFGLVRLEWHVGGNVNGPLWVERRHGSSRPLFLAEVDRNASDRVAYADEAVEPGERYGYRLGYELSGYRQYTDDVWVTLPELAAPTLSAVRPNPTSGKVSVRVGLTGSGRSRVEILDLAGRVWDRRELESLGPGWHNLTIAPRALPPGVYLLSLVQGTGRRVARFCILP